MKPEEKIKQLLAENARLSALAAEARACVELSKTDGWVTVFQKRFREWCARFDGEAPLLPGPLRVRLSDAAAAQYPDYKGRDGWVVGFDCDYVVVRFEGLPKDTPWCATSLIVVSGPTPLVQ